MNSNEEVKAEEREDGHCRHRHGRHRWKFIPIVIFMILVKGALVMVLWNALIPDLFHGPVLNFGQAIGLMVLAKLLVGFKGLRHFGEGGPRRHWKGRWSGLSREQREKIREHLRR